MYKEHILVEKILNNEQIIKMTLCTIKYFILMTERNKS